MAAGTALVVQVHGEALAIGHRLAFVEVGQIRVHPGRRLRDFLAEKMFTDEEAALGDAGIGGLRGRREEHGLAEDAGAPGLGGESHAVVLVLRGGQLVEQRQARIDEAVFGGEELREIQVAPDEIGDHAAGLFGHGDGEFGRIHGELAALFHGVEELIETKPFGYELVDGDFRARGSEQASGLLLDCFAGIEFAAGGGAEQFSVGHGVPEGVGEAAGGLVRSPARLGSVLGSEKKVGRLEHRFECQLRSAEERLLAQKQLFVPGEFRFEQRPTEGLGAEGPEEFLAAGAVLRFAGDESVGIAAAEGGARQFFSGSAVCFREQRRDGLGLELVAIAADEILRGELVSHSAIIAEQIAGRVVVLQVREPPQHRAGFELALPEQKAVVRLGVAGEVLDPSTEGGFFG